MPKIRDVAVATGKSRGTGAATGPHLAPHGAHAPINNPARLDATAPRPTLDHTGVA